MPAQEYPVTGTKTPFDRQRKPGTANPGTGIPNIESSDRGN